MSHRSEAEETWRERAECTRADLYDPDAWFDDPSFAKKVCRTRCPVANECLTWALEQPGRLDGVLGGMTEGERRRVRRTMKGRVA